MFVLMHIVQFGLKITALIAKICSFCDQQVFYLLYAHRKLLLVVLAWSWVFSSDDLDSLSLCTAVRPKWRLDRFIRNLHVGLVVRRAYAVKCAFFNK